MQAFDTQGTVRRSRIGRVALIVLAALTIGGGTFAATGGLQTLRSWLVTVEIGGETHTLELTEIGDQALSLETPDGGTARINIAQSAICDDGETIEVRVETANGEGDSALRKEECVGLARRHRVGTRVELNRDLGAQSLRDLGDAEPVKSWIDADGIDSELYVLASTDRDGSDIVLVTYEDATEPRVMRIAQTPIALHDGTADATFTIEDDGTLTIVVSDGGREMEMKIKTRREAADEFEPRPLNITTPDGTIKINLEPMEDDR